MTRKGPFLKMMRFLVNILICDVVGVQVVVLVAFELIKKSSDTGWSLIKNLLLLHHDNGNGIET